MSDNTHWLAGPLRQSMIAAANGDMELSRKLFKLHEEEFLRYLEEDDINEKAEK